MSELPALPVWVLDETVQAATLERLGDARKVADALGGDVGVLLVGPDVPDHPLLIRHGADFVCHVAVGTTGSQTRARIAVELLSPLRPRLVLTDGDGIGREWGARLAARNGWRLVSPTLLVQSRDGELIATGLDGEGRWARKISIPTGKTVVCTLRAGVAEAAPDDPLQTGTFLTLNRLPVPEPVSLVESIPADPTSVDIRHAARLVAGGRGLGGREGFETLRRIAGKLGAGVAASRMAVDLGWIEHTRQVGQTGQTVAPELYVACGISGASHHLEGMSQAKHVVAINTDPNASIFKSAHLGLVADLYSVLQHVEEGLAGE